MQAIKPTRRGMTLVEVLMAVVILAITSLATLTLLGGALNTDRYLRSSTTAVSEIELACRRITHNLRTCSALTSPATGVPQNSLTLVTQPDAANGNQSYTISYNLTNGKLQETDPRYGTNTIASNVASFSVAKVTTSTPVKVQVTITLSGAAPFTRQFVVYARNL